MLHLPSERLAAIADDEPTAAEAIHLAACSRCANERRAYSRLVESARALGQGESLTASEPLTEWSSLREHLAGKNLIASARPSRRGWIMRAGAVAASLVLVATGAAAGQWSAGAPILPQSFAGAGGAGNADEREFTSTAEALNVYLRSQRDFQRSAAYLAANSEGERGGGFDNATPSSVLTRLAALEEIYSASVAGLRNAPTDPVLNDYYMSVLGAREATRRQLNALPVSLTRY